MRFSCEGCGAQYAISDEKVGPNGVKVRCKKCGHVTPVRRGAAASPPVGDVAAVAAAGAERDALPPFDNVLGGGSAAVMAETRAARNAPTDDATPPAVDARADQDWYVAIDGQQVGPLAATAVKARWESGEIGPETLAWRAGMDDWTPLSGITEMTRLLAPVLAPASTPASATAGGSLDLMGSSVEAPVPLPGVTRPAAAPSAPNGVHGLNGTNGVNGKAKHHDVVWQPSAASALAALASQEIASTKADEPSAAVAGGSLLEKMDLPEGGVDPTHLVPLPMKGLEKTAEAQLKPVASASPERTELRQLKSSARRRGVAIGLGVAAAAAVAVFAVLWTTRPPSSTAPTQVTAVARPAPAPETAVPPPQVAAPAAQATSPAPAPAPAAPVAAAPPQVPAAPVSAPETASPTNAAPEPPAAAPREAPPAHAAAAPPPAEPAARAAPPAKGAASRAAADLPRKMTKRELAAARAAERKAQRASRLERPAEPSPRVAQAPAASPAAPAEARRKPAGDPLLDTGGDDELEKELSGGKPAKRSVYVPPAIGSDLPENVSVSQINEAVVSQKAALLKCIDQQKAADPVAKGTLKLRWIIGGDGTPRDVRVASDEFAKQPIGPCIAGVVRGIRFPRSRTTGQEVVFPFRF